MLLTSGVIARTVTLLPLRRITDLTWKETLLGQVLGYGTFRFESAGQDQALRHLTFLPRRADASTGTSAGCCSAATTGRRRRRRVGDDEGNDPAARPPLGTPRERTGSDTEPIPGLPPPQA